MSCPQLPERAFVVHGEDHAAESLCRRLRGELGWQAAVPVYGESADLIVRRAAIEGAWALAD